MNGDKSAVLRHQWQQLIADWPARFGAAPPCREALQSLQVQFRLPVGNLAGMGMNRPNAPPVSCDIVTFQNRPCMLIGAGEPGKVSSLDAVALRKILRAQQVAVASSLPIAYFWFGRCDIAPDPAEVFPDFDAAGVLLQRAAQASSAGISQFVYSQQTQGLGGLVAHALARRSFCDSEPHDVPPYGGFLAWLQERAALPQREPPVCHSDPTGTMPVRASKEYDTRQIITQLVDPGSFTEYRTEFGRTLICGYARIGELGVGIIANHKKHAREPGRPFEFAGVIYSESADKGARFILDCNQNRLPLLFLQDVNGFMVGREAEVSGIIRSGAKMVNAVSNSVVPKITLILGGSYGAGHYAMCGRAFDPLFLFGWPTARYAVMGGDQAARTLWQLQIRQAETTGRQLSAQDQEALFEGIRTAYERQLDPRYAASRLWIDHIVFPQDTRLLLFRALEIALYAPKWRELRTGVIQT
ncbi:MAG: acyl-CoA carboxylase subunit beta [Acidobacteria bacterium]|nr:acyl-CoA carboxylase subunit beta [Acidobacteriota bacterium]